LSLARDIVDRIFFPDRDVHAIPVLDGGFSPNQRLEECDHLAGFVGADALAFGPDGRLYVSAADSVLACDGDRFQSRQIFATVDTTAGALAWTNDGVLLVGIADRGVRAFDRNGEPIATLSEAGGAPVTCPTAIAVAADGTVFVTDGSRHNGPEQWLRDLMESRPPSGRLIACGPGLRDARVLADGLSWPAGVAVAHDEQEVLVTESWTHRLSAVSRTDGRVRLIVKNFAGYPARLARAPGGNYWAAFFALRTQLTEFVLREHSFRERMMERVPPELWIGPSLGGRFDYREPTQIGRIKKLGIQKPWAPARSYGLVARLDATGYALESLHSRVSGTLHGVTAAVEHDGRLVIASKGHGKLALCPLGARH
jgi:DNA-binding beta-propeller fold protein YncE